MPTPDASIADIRARASGQFVLVGNSYGRNLALRVALAAPERISACWLMGCDPKTPKSGGTDPAAAVASDPDAMIDMLSGLVVRKVRRLRPFADPGAAERIRRAVRDIPHGFGVDS